MISTFGCVNALILAGARAYYAMARQGLFLRFPGVLNHAKVPGPALLIQGGWAMLLVLPRTYNPATSAWGNLYSYFLNYVISAALLFYVLTVAGVFRLRRRRPDAPRPYRTWCYPYVPLTFVFIALFILADTFIEQNGSAGFNLKWTATDNVDVELDAHHSYANSDGGAAGTNNFGIVGQWPALSPTFEQQQADQVPGSTGS